MHTSSVSESLPPVGNLSRRTSKLALVSLVVSLLSFLTLGLTSLVAVICGHVALNRVRKHHLGGRGMALTGTTLGYLGLAGFLFLMGSLLPPAIQGALLTEKQSTLHNDLNAIYLDFKTASETGITSAGQPLGWPANSSVVSKADLIEKYRSGEVQAKLVQLFRSANLSAASGLISGIAPENLTRIQITNCSESDPANTIVAFRQASRSDPVGGVVLRDGRCFTFLADSGQRPSDFGTLPERIPQLLAD